MPYLLNVVYLLLILVSLPWLAWQALTKGKYRAGYAEKLLGLVPRRPASPRKCLWLHAVSVGEVNLLAPLLKLIAQQRPDWECVISTTTLTGMTLARKKYPELTSFYCPLDFTWATAAAMRRVRPDVLVLAELELWPNLVRAARRGGARVAVINGRLSEKSFQGYRRIGWLAARTLRQIDLIAVQDETYAERFRALGARLQAVVVTGSMKYDGAQTDRGNPATQRLAALAGIGPDDVVLLAGSTQEPEEAAAIEVFRRLNPQSPRLRLAIVPRHPERFAAVARLLDESGLPWQRRTELMEDGRRQMAEGRGEKAEGRFQIAEGHKAATVGRDERDGGWQMEDVRRQIADGEPRMEATLSRDAQRNDLHAEATLSRDAQRSALQRETASHSATQPNAPRILLVDVVGELGAWWGTAQIAFVGGSLGNRGGQNMIEPAAYGAAVSFGPNTRNFRDIVATMLAHDAAAVVAGADELAAFVGRCLTEPAYAAALGQRARQLVQSQLGATERTLRRLAPLVEPPGPSAGAEGADSDAPPSAAGLSDGAECPGPLFRPHRPPGLPSAKRLV